MTEVIVMLVLAALIFASTHTGPTRSRAIRFVCGVVMLASVGLMARTQYVRGKTDGIRCAREVLSGLNHEACE